MSLFTDASLVLVPSGVKSQKVYSIKPTDGSGDLTFSRSNDTATRVDSSGLISKVHTNELLQSNSFDTTWTNSNSTETGGQAGYDGTNDAWLLTAAGTSNAYIDQALSLNAVQTLSVYAKAGTASFIELVTIGGGTNPRAWFNLSSGSVGTSYNTIDTNITSVGGGWYRCSITLNQNISNYRFYVADADDSTAVTNGAYIYIQDAQLEQGLVATPYIETTTAAVSVGPVANLPRLSYDPANPTCPSLLLEPQRTQLFTFSEYMNGLTFIQATATENAETSPEGVVNAARLYDNAVDGQHRISESLSATSGTTYTWSIFAKKGTLRYCYLISTAAGTSRYFFDLQEGTAITSGGKIEDYGNGWYRLSAQVTATSTGNAVFGFNLTDSSSNNTYAGTGTDYHSIYGFQCEEGSFVSSYLPSYGTATTRGADSASKTGISSLIGQTEGTLFLETNTEYYESSNMNFALSDGSNTNNVKFIYELATKKWKAEVNNNGSTMAVIETGVIARGTRVKLAVAYANNDFVFYMNGSLIGTDPSGSTTFPVTLSKISTDRGDGIASLDGNLYQALVFKTRLTNAQLAELTA